ncbi:hypothetical protein [Pseudonocardia abyssalis]|uniref:Uncharacterized protein n=1 Tax=Pseudonocardia abyssalis TaxID=2792008 RepID=A0ABS6UYM4_9PSEU|nr:hypothetical protein [Pseudonocardia abyssalis]MBW0118264.1 hypothetical protein [Pseudonocardia abyssalis]MBW0137340.1 hypothetical protein [Pseudonocardia abyssalis]
MRDSESSAEWCTHFARTVADEIRTGVQTGALTFGEADQLLARMQVLLEQALDLAPQPV